MKKETLIQAAFIFGVMGLTSLGITTLCSLFTIFDKEAATYHALVAFIFLYLSQYARNLALDK